MLRRLAVVLGAAVLAMLVAVVPPPAAARDAAVCTGWDSEYQPPASILVLRTSGPRAGRVVDVPFRSYVETVLAAEFGRTTPREALRAGAVAVKQYAWYYAIHWRGGRAGGACYDVVDSARDQIYRPETYRAADALKDAVTFTWPLSLRKFGRFFMTGYRDGATVACASNADGWRLYQLSAYRCASEGRRLKQILHAFFDPGLEIVVPGERDSTGDAVGDAVAIASAGGGSATDPAGDAEAAAPPGLQVRVYDGRSLWAGSSGRVATTTLTPDAAAAVTWARGDVTGDRVDDVVRLERTDTSARITVLVAANGTFQAPRAFWSGKLPAGAVAGAIVRLLVGDFDGDGKADAALLVGSAAPSPDAAPAPAEAPAAALWLLQSNGTAFAKPVSWWRGHVDLGRASAVAGDVTGDGEDDLVLGIDAPPSPDSATAAAAADGPGTSRSGRAAASSGVRYEVAASRTSAGLGDPVVWLDAPGADVQQTHVLVGDVNRDGRDDLVADGAMDSGGSHVTALLSTGGSFWAADLWSSASFRWAASKVTAADVDADGRADVVVFYDLGGRGTRISQLVWNGAGLRSVGGQTDPSLAWSTTVVL